MLKKQETLYNHNMKFVCESCGQQHLKWIGKCACGEWNSLVEVVDKKNPSLNSFKALKLVDLEGSLADLEIPDRIATSISEFDRTIGGGLVPGGVILISGDPGVGKSTLLLQISNSKFEDNEPENNDVKDNSIKDNEVENDNLKNKKPIPKNGRKKHVIYISGEESIMQIKLRAKRLEIKGNVKLSASNNLEEILATLEENKDQTILVIIDSIQTIASENLDGASGSVGQIRYCAQKLIEFAKLYNIALIIVGHVTKEGTIAGPKILEHSVDTVLHFEGERNYSFRILRTIKNRFGSTDEIGIFEIRENGLQQVENPSLLFLNQQQTGTSGSIIFPSMEGTRLLMIEIQALVSQSFLQMPRRAVIGWDHNRLPMICAVLEKHCKISFANKDVYLNVMGGLRINEPAADLAVLLVIISSYLNIPIPANYVAFGEIGLSGEIRSVQNTLKRINEANKLSCKGIICPIIKENTENMIQFKNIKQVVEWMKQLGQKQGV